MRFRLVPRDESFYLMFNEAAKNAKQCADELRGRMIDLPNGAAGAQRVVEAERRGDELNRRIRERLDQVIVTPFDREDIHALSEQLDDALDNMRAASDLVGLHNVTETITGVIEMIDILGQAAEQLVALVAKLSRLRDMESELDEINRLEAAGDDVYRRTTAELFSGRYDTFTVLKWMGIVDAMEEALDAFYDTSRMIATIALKHA
jgi:predicted phosphate transport protein (TIGR00153 family)